MKPPASYPPGMAVMNDDPEQAPVALGALAPAVGPPLRVVQVYLAVSLHSVSALDVGGRGWVFDFGQNFAGMTRLDLPAGHGLPAGTVLRIAQAEILAGPFTDTGGMCKLCPGCGACDPGPPPDIPSSTADRDGDGDGAPEVGVTAGLRGNVDCSTNNAAAGALCDTYCATAAHAGLGKPLRHEPCFPHQSYTKGGRPHETPDRYIGDFNNANQTNVYVVGHGDKAESYTPLFAAGGLRYAQLTGLPPHMQPSRSWLSGLKVNSAVRSVANLSLPVVRGRGSGTADVLNRIHTMVRASQTSNLWSTHTAASPLSLTALPPGLCPWLDLVWNSLWPVACATHAVQSDSRIHC